MPQQLDLFTGAEIAPKTKTQKTKKETKTMKSMRMNAAQLDAKIKGMIVASVAKPSAAKPSASKPAPVASSAQARAPEKKPAPKIVKTATKTGHTLAAVAKDRPPVIVATIERKDAPAPAKLSKPAPKLDAAPAFKVSPAVAAANNKAIQAAAKKIAKEETDKIFGKLPPKSWEAFQLDGDAQLVAALPSVAFRPKSAAGLVKIHALGLYAKPAEIAAYHAARRAVMFARREYFRKYPAAVYEGEILAAGRNEAAALVACGINYHDDRGDGLLWVPEFRNAARLAAWRTAAAAAGVKASKVRAA